MSVPTLLVIVALILALVVPLSLSGYAVWDEWGGEWLEEVHEFFGNTLLFVVLAHIGLIALLSALVAVQTITDKSKLVIDQRLAGLSVAIIALLLKAPFPVVVLGSAVASAITFRYLS